MIPKGALPFGPDDDLHIALERLIDQVAWRVQDSGRLRRLKHKGVGGRNLR